MTKLQSWAMLGISVTALAIGVLLATGALTSAQSPTPTPSTGSTFKSNEDPTHEAGESAEREAQEDAGIFPHGGEHHRGGGSNEDATHESSESPEREAQEDANQAPTAVSPTPGA